MFWKRFNTPLSYFNTFRLQHQLVEKKFENCEYPPIIDMSPDGQRRHQRQLWYDSIEAMPTVEEKLYELAVQQRLKLKKYLLYSVPPSYNGIYFQRYITRSLLIEGLPDKINQINVENELSQIKDDLNKIVTNYYYNPWENEEKPLSHYLNEEKAGAKLLEQLICQCYKKLAPRNEHILESTFQKYPRLSSFWWHSGFESEKDKLFEKNLCFMFKDIPAFAIRIKKPLSPILEMNDPLCATAEVPDYHYHPRVFGFPSIRGSSVASVPGFWPGDPNEFPLLQVLSSHRLQTLLQKIDHYNLKQIENSAGLMTSFGYLNAVATYQGFSPFHDITYPFVTQTILTNGQDFTFFVYQLNTIAFHEDVDNKDRRNLCWASEKLRLFDTIEDGQLKGINEDVYRLLLRFLLNTPEVKDGLILKPYLGVDTRTEEEVANMRYFLRKMYSGARAHDAYKEEIPDWVRIYKNHPDAPLSPYVKLQ
ncbi:28S ribosomal protein S30, mitochondrial [Caerostris darwini]|uniref:28S ribosomal protein S30, mitochondrial n=1 Tax=Caerostris darwini TaxID=1538125 RepID=A0AAV4U4F6_9ARAC|nr:28S ribosomal protein S30, mitochondrial [Caerostris darwini]